MGDPQDRIALPLSDVIKKDWNPTARKKGGKSSGKQGSGAAANIAQRKAGVNGGKFGGMDANARKGTGKGMVISKFNKKKIAGSSTAKGAAKGTAKGGAKGVAKGARAGAWKGGGKGGAKGTRKAMAAGASQGGGGKNGGQGKGGRPLASRIWSGAVGKNKGAAVKKGTGRGAKGIGKGAAKGSSKGVGRGVGRGMGRTTMMAPNKRVNRAIGGIVKQSRDSFIGRGSNSMKGKGRREQGKGRVEKGKGRSEKGGGKGWKGKEAAHEKGMQAGMSGKKGAGKGKRDDHGSWGRGGNQGKGGGKQRNWDDRWEGFPGGDRNANGGRAKSWDAFSKGRQGYSDDGWSGQRRNSGKGSGNAVDSLSADDRRMMKKITIVAQLDKVPKPPPAMRGAAVGEGRSSRGQGGSLSSRFGANFDR